MKARALAYGLAIVVGSAVSAQGAVLATQPVFVNNGQVLYCKIANVSTRDQEVTIEVVNPLGNVIMANTVTILAGRSTSLAVNGPFQNLSCRFTCGGRRNFRAGASVGDNTNDFFAIPAT